jgi:uncharacterized membrane-anchored protein YhcB (DUF1043 family)
MKTIPIFPATFAQMEAFVALVYQIASGKAKLPLEFLQASASSMMVQLAVDVKLNKTQEALDEYRQEMDEYMNRSDENESDQSSQRS